ncbi:MAG: CvpA family protein [Verrucomicrobiae bacterium]|nr:CvpA family protein [Verrucomicrobiae bacterium]
MYPVATTRLLEGWNWYDYTAAGFVAIGLYVGLRSGLVESFCRLTTWTMMIAAGLLLYSSVAPWLSTLLAVEADTAKFQAFLATGFLVYLAGRFITRQVVPHVSHRPLPALLDNLGGALLGASAMTMVVVWTSMVLVLGRSAFWHEQVAVRSYWGARIMQQFPALVVTPKKETWQKWWFFGPIERRTEPAPDSKNTR